jgi:hypothetical protein
MPFVVLAPTSHGYHVVHGESVGQSCSCDHTTTLWSDKMNSGLVGSGYGQPLFGLCKGTLNKLALILFRSTLSLVLISRALQAQVQMVLDLSKNEPGTLPSETRPAEGDFSLVVLNKLPGTRYRYSLDVNLERQPIAPLVLPAMLGVVPGTRQTMKEPGGKLSVLVVCSSEQAKELDDAVKSLQDSESESTIPAAIAQANEIVDHPENYSACATAGPTIESLRRLIKLTSSTQPLPHVAPDEDVVVTLSRLDTKTNTLVKWTKRYSGRPRGEWVTTYGLTFLTTWTAPSATYTTHATAASDKFVIQEDRMEDQLRFAPTVFFTWQPSSANLNPNASLAVTGGLGFDLSNPVALLGVSFVWNRAVAAHIGLAAAKVDRLAKLYRIGDTIGTNLTQDQLRYSPYKVNPYIALSFTLSSNPFGGSDHASPKDSNGSTSQPAPETTTPVQSDQTPGSATAPAPSSTPAPAPTPTPAPIPSPTPTPAPAPSPDTAPGPAPGAGTTALPSPAPNP